MESRCDGNDSSVIRCIMCFGFYFNGNFQWQNVTLIVLSSFLFSSCKRLLEISSQRSLRHSKNCTFSIWPCNNMITTWYVAAWFILFFVPIYTVHICEKWSITVNVKGFITDFHVYTLYCIFLWQYWMSHKISIKKITDSLPICFSWMIASIRVRNERKIHILRILFRLYPFTFQWCFIIIIPFYVLRLWDKFPISINSLIRITSTTLSKSFQRKKRAYCHSCEEWREWKAIDTVDVWTLKPIKLIQLKRKL